MPTYLREWSLGVIAGVAVPCVSRSANRRTHDKDLAVESLTAVNASARRRAQAEPGALLVFDFLFILTVIGLGFIRPLFFPPLATFYRDG